MEMDGPKPSKLLAVGKYGGTWYYQNKDNVVEDFDLDHDALDAQISDRATALSIDDITQLTESHNFQLDSMTQPQVDFLILVSAYKGFDANVRLLMARENAETCETRVYGHNALHLAVIQGHVRCVSAILGPRDHRSTWLRVTVFKVYSHLHLAVYFKHVDVLELLLKSAGDDRDLIKFLHNTNKLCEPLHVAAMMDSVPAAKILLENGAAVDGGPEVAYTPLHMAAQEGNGAVTLSLLQHGAFVGHECPDGVSALALIEGNVPHVLTTLLDSCLSVDKPEIRCSKFQVHVQTRPLTRLRMMLTTSLVHELATRGSQHRLEHPACQIVVKEIFKRILPIYFPYFFWTLFSVVWTSIYLASSYGCRCPLPSWSHFSVNGTNSSCEYASEICDYYSGTYGNIAYYAVAPMAFLNILFKILEPVIFRKHPHRVINAVKHVFEPESLVDWTCWPLVLWLFFADGQVKSSTAQNVSPVVMLVVWGTLMYKVEKLPVVGVYMSMFLSVAREYFVMFTAFMWLLVAYGHAFSMIFTPSEAYPKYLAYFTAKTASMMIGDLGFNELIIEQKHEYVPGVVSVVLVSFIVLIVFVLANLLIGIVVCDIEGLKRDAICNSLAKRVELIRNVEFFMDRACRLFRKPMPLILNRTGCQITKQYDRSRQRFGIIGRTDNSMTDGLYEKAIEIVARREKTERESEENELMWDMFKHALKTMKAEESGSSVNR